MPEKLSEFFVKKATSELRENESRKSQSIKILKDWSLKHSFIRILDPDCVTPKVLLPFLRTKKYAMEKVYESVEKTLTFLKYHKNWCDFQGWSLKRALDLYDSGYMIVTKDRDADGRKVIICSNTIDSKRFTSDDVFRLIVLVYSTLYHEEETQIGGVIYVTDLRHITMNYLTLFSIKDFYEFTMQLKSTPIRSKKIILLGMPAMASQLVNIAKAAFSEKIKQRLVSLSDADDLSTHVDTSILSKEYGGSTTSAEFIADFRPRMVEIAEFISTFYGKYEIDFSQIDNFCGADSTGSFRKLEVD